MLRISSGKAKDRVLNVEKISLSQMKSFIGNATPYQIKQMFLRFYEGANTMSDEFVRKLGDYPVSTAQLQGHFMFHKKDPKGALEHVSWLLPQMKKAA